MPLLIKYFNILILLTAKVGRIEIRTRPQLFNQTEDLIFKTVQLGGRYEPAECQSRNKVAIVVPFRDRVKHLRIFLRHIHSFLQRQQLAYAIFVIEQSTDDGY